MSRDFTYVDDIIEGVYRLIPYVPKDVKSDAQFIPYSIFNIGNNSPVKLMAFVKALEEEIGKKAEINFMPIQKGDVPTTYADISELIEAVDYKPSTSIKTGIMNFVNWYRKYYKV